MNFIKTMIDEKGILEDSLEIEVNGTMNYMTVENVVEMIENEDAEVKEMIKSTLSKIDFQNGDIKHFLIYLAKGFIMHVYTN